MQIEVRWEHLASLIGNLEANPKVSERAVSKAIKAAGAEAHKHIRRAAPRGAAPHVVAPGVRRRSRGRGFGTTVTIGLYGTPANVVARGSPAHDVRPKTMQALNWLGAEHPVTGAVHIPAIPANPFFSRGVDAARSAIQGAFDKAGDEIVAALVKK